MSNIISVVTLGNRLLQLALKQVTSVTSIKIDVFRSSNIEDELHFVLNIQCMSQSMSINVTYFDLVPYNSIVLTGPEVATCFFDYSSMFR